MVPESSKKNFGLIGYPVEHSLSPIIHSTLGAETDVDLSYPLYCIEKDDLGSFIKDSYDLGINGFNVTVPYKQEVMQYLCDIDEEAKAIGAVNTLVRTENGYKGYNTDMPGVMEAMAEEGIVIKGSNVVVIGAGGAARAIVMGVINEGPAKLMILNRTKEKGAELASEYGYEGAIIAGYDDDFVAMMDEVSGGKKWIAIQTTSVGMYPKVVFSPVTNKEFYTRIDKAYDIIFNPAETLFMKKVREAGGEAYNGLKMLAYQGCRSYEYWTGKKITADMKKKVCAALIK